MKRIVFLLSILCFCMSTAWGQYTHDKKAYKSHFTAEQQKMHNAHLKELKKSKRFATIEPFFPSSNRIKELERSIREYERLLDEAKKKEIQYRAEGSAFLGSTLEDINRYEKTIREKQSEIEKLKREYNL